MHQTEYSLAVRIKQCSSPKQDHLGRKATFNKYSEHKCNHASIFGMGSIKGHSLIGHWDISVLLPLQQLYFHHKAGPPLVLGGDTRDLVHIPTGSFLTLDLHQHTMQLVSNATVMK